MQLEDHERQTIMHHATMCQWETEAMQHYVTLLANWVYHEPDDASTHGRLLRKAMAAYDRREKSRHSLRFVLSGQAPPDY